MFFPLPFIHHAFKQINLEAESSTDNHVLKHGSRATQYASDLLTLAERNKPTENVSKNTHSHIKTKNRSQNISYYAIGITGSSELAKRIARIIEPIAVREPLHIQHKLTASVFTILFIIPVAAISPTCNTTDQHQKIITLDVLPHQHLSDKHKDIKELLRQDEKKSSPTTGPLKPPSYNLKEIKDNASDIFDKNAALTHNATIQIEPNDIEWSIQKTQDSPTLSLSDTLISKPDFQKEKSIILMKKIKPITPIYPRYAVRNKIEGEVHITYSINTKGKANNIKIISNHPSNIFNRAVLKAMDKSRFELNNKALTKDLNAIRFNQVFTFRLVSKKHINSS